MRNYSGALVDTAGSWQSREEMARLVPALPKHVCCTHLSQSMLRQSLCFTSLYSSLQRHQYDQNSTYVVLAVITRKFFRVRAPSPQLLNTHTHPTKAKVSVVVFRISRQLYSYLILSYLEEHIN